MKQGRMTHSRLCRRAMTLPELIIGTLMLGMVGSALASFATAMAAGWENSNRQFKVSSVGQRSAEALKQQLSGMLYVAQSKAASSGSPSSYVFYWARDGGLVAADRMAQLGEMSLIEYDPTNKAVWLYKPKSGLNPTQVATLQQGTWGDPTAPAIVTYFKGLDSIEKTPLVGGADTGIDVNMANFSHFTPTGSKSMTSYTMRLTKECAQDTSAGTVPMRVRKKPTNF